MNELRILLDATDSDHVEFAKTTPRSFFRIGQRLLYITAAHRPVP